MTKRQSWRNCIKLYKWYLSHIETEETRIFKKIVIVINKEDIPLDIYYINNLGSLPSIKRNYLHFFIVIDIFSKYF